MDTKQIFKILGLNVKKYRLLKKMKVKELAELSHINFRYIYKIEKGLAYGITTDQVFALSLALNVESYKLIS